MINQVLKYSDKRSVHTICFLISPYLCENFFLSIIYLCIFARWFICFSPLSFSVCVCQFLFVSVSLSVNLFVNLFVNLSVILSVCLSLSLSLLLARTLICFLPFSLSHAFDLPFEDDEEVLPGLGYSQSQKRS